MGPRGRGAAILGRAGLAALALSTAPPAAAQTDLEALLLDPPPPGYTVLPAGEGNQALSAAEATALFRQAGADIDADLFEGGYIRTWVNADVGFLTSVVISASEPVQAKPFLRGFRDAADDRENTTIFDIPGVPDSVGATIVGPIPGVPGTGYIQSVVFVKRDHLFFDSVGSIGQSRHTPQDAVEMAVRHHARVAHLPAADDEADSTAYKLGAALAALLVPAGAAAIVVVMVIRRRQGAPAAATVVFGAQAAAWIPDPTGRHQSRYWDGTSWTEHVADDENQSSDPLPR